MDSVNKIGFLEAIGELGIRPVINASAPKSNFGGMRLNPDIAAAVAEAQRYFFDIGELNRSIGKYAASQFNAEAAIVTGGTSAGILASLGAALDVNLADTNEFSEGNEVVIRRSDFGHYAYLFRMANAKIVEAGNIVSCSANELARGITSKTAAVAVVLSPRLPPTDLSLDEIVTIAHSKNVPVIVDAAAIFPSRDNVSRLVASGCDALAISGGKIIGGPQATGLLLGRAEFIEKAFTHSFPHDGISRPVKTDRGQMIGLFFALKYFLSHDPSSILEGIRIRNDLMYDLLSDSEYFMVHRHNEILVDEVPMLSISCLEGHNTDVLADVADYLLKQTPSIYILHIPARRILCLSPMSLTDEEAVCVCSQLILAFRTISSRRS